MSLAAVARFMPLLSKPCFHVMQGVPDAASLDVCRALTASAPCTQRPGLDAKVMRRGPLVVPPIRADVASHGASLRTSLSPCRCSRSSLPSLRNIGRVPPFHPLRLDTVLPSALRGPVDLDHGCHRRIASA